MPSPTANNAPRLDEPVLRYARKEFVRVSVDGTVESALVQARRAAPDARILHFYVVDSEGVLAGVLPTRSLLLSEPTVPVRELMQSPVVSIRDTATLADACEFFLLHRFLALPVVDSEGRMVGVVDVEVYADEMSDLATRDAKREESEDFFQLIGVRLAEVRRVSPDVAFYRRFPWLLCNVVGGLAAAIVASFFKGVLDRVVTVSLFIPVVLAVAESVSIQSLSLTLQAHHSWSRVRFRSVLIALVREAPVGALLGLGCASAVAASVLIWSGDGPLALCLMLSVGSSVLLATAFGVLAPMSLHAARLDPRIASGPIVLTLTDLATLIVYLSLAAAMLS